MKRLVVVLSLAGVWTVGCDNGSNVATANAGPTAAEFAARYCQIIEPCCADAGFSTSGNQCRGQFDGTGYDPVAGQACLGALDAASKNSAFCSSDFVGLSALPQCQYVFGGQAVAPGEPCTSNFDCAMAAGGSALCFMQASGGGSTGTCVQTQTGAVGQGPCVATFKGFPSQQWIGPPPPSTGYTCDVADGVWCNPTTHECTALGTTGQLCWADEDCVTSDYCASGSCRLRVAVGAACGNTSGECVNTAYCDFSSSSICKPLLPNGSACTDPSTCQSFNCDNGKCASVSTVPLAMTCGT